MLLSHCTLKVVSQCPGRDQFLVIVSLATAHGRPAVRRGWPWPLLRLGRPRSAGCHQCSARWPRAWAPPPRPCAGAAACSAGKTPPQIFWSGKKVLCLFSSEKKHLEDFFFLRKALSFRRNLGMLLFKKKKCLQCISHPFRSEHDLCEEMVFLKN